MRKLITANEVVEQALVIDTIDLSFIKDSFIEISQEEHLRPILTQDFYDLLVAETNAQVFTGSNETLINNYIKPALAFFVVADVILLIAMKINNKGVMVGDSETSNPASRQDRLDLNTRYKEQGQTLLNKMQRYLDNNKNLFPLYENGSSSIVSTKIIGGIIF